MYGQLPLAHSIRSASGRASLPLMNREAETG